MIFILDRQLKIVDTLKNDGGAFQASPFFDDTLTEDLATGAETFQFKTILTKQASENLVIGNYVAFKRDGKTKLFQIVQTVQDHQEAVYCEVYCECAGLELINNVFRKTTFVSVSLENFMNSVLSDTTWSVGYIDGALLTPQDLTIEDASVYSVLQDNVSKFGGEIEFRVELKKGRIINKFVDVYAHRGKDTGKRFEFGKDIESIVRKIDSTNLYTALIGVGNNNISFKDVEVAGINKPKGQDFVFDQASFDRYNNNGYHLMGVFKVDTDSPEELLRKTFEQLQKVKEPQFSYEIQVALLGKLLGESWNTVKIGDRVSIVDNAFNPPIHLMARVSKLVTSETNPESNSCVLSNFMEVSSNISKEMREMASELKGYVDGTVDSKFPIGSEDIQKGAVKTEHIYRSSIITDHLQAGSVTVEKIDSKYIESVKGKFDELEVSKANIKDLLATNVKIDNLTSTTANIKELVSENINVTSNLQAENAKIRKLIADNIAAADGKFTEIEAKKANVDDFTAVSANIDKLKGTVGEIETLVSGNLTSKNIAVGAITAGSGIIAEGAIGSAQISSLDVNKLNAGILDTSKIQIQGAKNRLRIVGDQLQIFDTNPEDKLYERIMLGVDESNNSVLVLRGKDGRTTLLNQDGLTDAGFTNGYGKVKDNSLDASKFDMNSIVRGLNKDGSELIKGSKVQVGDRTLDVELSTQNNKMDEQNKELMTQKATISALDDQIKLKVDNQTFKKAIKEIESKTPLRIDIFSTNGNVFRNGKGETTLIAKVYKGSEEITDTLDKSKFQWTRVSIDTEADKVWNEAHKNIGKSFKVDSIDISLSATFNLNVEID